MLFVGPHEIKINRAVKLSKVGAHEASFGAMLDHLTPDMRESMTAAQIAATVDALWSCAQASKAIAVRDAIREGMIWDASEYRHREIAG